MKKRIAALLMMALLAIGLMAAAHARGLEKRDIYDASLEELECYLNGIESAPLEDLFMNFSELGRFEMSAELAVYTDVLCNLERDEYGRIFLYLDVLKMNTEFCQFLEESDYLGTIEELENYARGRQAEANGDSEAAAGYYSQCMSFMDSMTRILNYRSNNMEEQYLLACGYYKQDTLEGYEQAYAIFSELAVYNYNNSAAMMDMSAWFISALSREMPAAPASTAAATPTPEVAVAPAPAPVVVSNIDLTAGFSNDIASLSWGAVPGATMYRIYRANGKAEAMKELVVIDETASVSYSDTKVTKGIFNTYQVDAVNAEGAVIGRSALESVYAVSKSWGSWSSWSTQKPTANSTTQVESKTQYRSRSITKKQEYTDWSSWSAWDTTAVASSNLVDVETKAVAEPIYKTVTKYSYSRWRYWKTSTDAWSYSYAKYTTTPANGGVYGGQGSWQYKTTSSPLAVDHKTDGRNVYSGIWYNQSTSTETVQDGTKNVTYYRSRTRTQELVTTWSSWSSWGDAYLQENSTREVETRTVYRYRKYQ